MRNGSVNAEGRPRVVEKLGIGSAPIGIESFTDVVTRHLTVSRHDPKVEAAVTWGCCRRSTAAPSCTLQRGESGETPQV
jgi:hypothetical protein